ncbi:MAG: carboxypeptidase regulatory-like domain-containing protein [Phycisphaerae bacterium]
MYPNRLLPVALGAAFLASTLAVPAAASDNAVIKGKVVFKGDVKRYPRRLLNTSKDPNCKKSKAKIGSYNVILNKKTDPVTVRNVLVFVRQGLGDRVFAPPTEPCVLKQFGCEYKPHVMGVMEGQPLRVENGDDTNHNIHFLAKINEQHNFTQPKKGMTKDVTLVKESVFKVKCDVHPWMGCYIGVFTHPFFDVTGKDGTFELNGLPPGTYVIESWHEKFGAQTTEVTVAVDETKEIDFTYEPDAKK